MSRWEYKRSLTKAGYNCDVCGNYILGLFNLIPIFPGLDGSLPGLWGLEKLLGKNKGRAFTENACKIGFIIMMLLQIIICYYWIFG